MRMKNQFQRELKAREMGFNNQVRRDPPHDVVNYDQDILSIPQLISTFYSLAVHPYPPIPQPFHA